MKNSKMTSCNRCFGTGYKLATESPWGRLPGCCEACKGLGVLNAIRADAVGAGSLFEDFKGRVWMKVKNTECSALISAAPQFGENAGKPELFMANSPVRVVRECDLAVMQVRQ